MKAGIALVTEDRQITGLATKLPVAFNMTLANTDGISRWGVLDLERQASVTAEYQKKLRIRMASPKQLAGRLSGGNQQKVVIGKWLFRGARVFLFDEPTRGIDVGAKVEVFEVMDELARSGAAVLMVSSEMQELLQVADRILVMRQGRITGELPGRTRRRKRSCGSRRCEVKVMSRPEYRRSHAEGSAVRQPDRSVRRAGHRVAALSDAARICRAWSGRRR